MVSGLRHGLTALYKYHVVFFFSTLSLSSSKVGFREPLGNCNKKMPGVNGVILTNIPSGGDCLMLLVFSCYRALSSQAEDSTHQHQLMTKKLLCSPVNCSM